MSKEKYDIHLLNSLQAEVDRFNKRLDDAKNNLLEAKDRYDVSSQKRASLMRACLDLRIELSKITQSTVY